MIPHNESTSQEVDEGNWTYRKTILEVTPHGFDIIDPDGDEFAINIPLATAIKICDKFNELEKLREAEEVSDLKRYWIWFDEEESGELKNEAVENGEWMKADEVLPKIAAMKEKIANQERAHEASCVLAGEQAEKIAQLQAEKERMHGKVAEAVKAIKQTMKQYDPPRRGLNTKKGEYEVSFLYPGDNKAYKMLYKFLTENEALASLPEDTNK